MRLLEIIYEWDLLTRSDYFVTPCCWCVIHSSFLPRSHQIQMGLTQRENQCDVTDHTIGWITSELDYSLHRSQIGSILLSISI